MHFIIISKKDKFKPEVIDEKILDSSKAPSLISREAIKFEISNFIVYVYPYDHIDHEVFGYSYFHDNDKLLLINGMVNIDENLQNCNISDLFDQLKDSSTLFGDYQLVSIDKDGNGFIKTPSLSIRQLFFYEDETCTVLSTEIKLIVDGVIKLREKTFVNHFDIDFVEDSVFREWDIRLFPENTIFKEIKRIFPHDYKFFTKGKVIIERNESIKIPKWFRDEYNANKSKLYDSYHDVLMNFAETNLLHLKPNIKKITLGLTGGFDSRLTVSILAKICKKHQICFECNTGGQDNHPDVVIAQKIAKVLDVEHFHYKPSNNIAPNSKEYADYALTFYMSQGDFNSKDFVPNYDRHITDLEIIPQLGMDAFKRTTLDKLYSANRWFARRILFKRNFFFPLFFTSHETWFAFLYEEIGEWDKFKEFVYEILKRSEPELLEIPFVGTSLPQVSVKPYMGKMDSVHHAKEPFLWDYNFVKNNLKSLLDQNNLGIKGKLILQLFDLNELDYFLNKELSKIIELYRNNSISLLECIKKIRNESNSEKYPKTKIMINMTKDSMKDEYIPKMQILMDFAAVANKKSFLEIERDLNLY